jgi:hypothetical protein
MRNLHDGKILQDVTFSLLSDNGIGGTREETYRGAWVIVDNGYLPRATTVPPMKEPSTFPELRWSKYTESSRKDVERVIGVGKMRFRCLKAGIRIRGSNVFTKFDNIWLTCCALHNWLLDVDGLSAEWKEGVQGDCQSSWGLHDEKDAQRFGVTRDYDASAPSASRDTEDQTEDSEEEVDLVEVSISGEQLVRKMKLAVFRGKLVDHFDYKWRRQEIRWPSRTGTAVWEPPESMRLYEAFLTARARGSAIA